MKIKAIKKVGLLPLILSLLLLTATLGANKADANPVNPISNATQLAWWHGGWNHGYGWHRGYGHSRCSCWINRWGHRRCNCW